MASEQEKITKRKPEQILERILDLSNDLQQEITADFELIGIQELRDSINAVELKIHDLRQRFENRNK